MPVISGMTSNLLQFEHTSVLHGIFISGRTELLYPAVLQVHLTRGAILPDHIVASSGLKCELLMGGGWEEGGEGRCRSNAQFWTVLMYIIL